MDYQVRIVSDRKKLKDFLTLPYFIYRDNRHWVAPMIVEQKRMLNPRKNPYFSGQVSLQLFNCYRDEEICSRVAVIINQHYHRKSGIKSAFFGFFESFNEPMAVAWLFDRVERYLGFNLIDQIEGPFNPNHYSELGLRASHFDSTPTFFQPYNPSYYHDLLACNGFNISKKIHTRLNPDVKNYFAGKPINRDTRIEDGYTVRPMHKNDFERELERLREIFNDAFSDNWKFLPVSQPEYRFCAKYLDLVTYPRLIWFVEHNGKPVAAIQFVLDINPGLKKFRGRQNIFRYLQFLYKKKNIRKLIVFAVGIKKSYRRTPAFRLLLQKTIDVAKQYDVLETTWMSPENQSALHAADILGLKEDIAFYLYSKTYNKFSE